MQATPHNLLVWNGQLTSRGRLRGWVLLLSSLAVLWMLLFLVIPCGVLVAMGFVGRSVYGPPDWSVWTLDHYEQLAGYNIFGWSADNLRILLRTVVLSAVTTVLCVGIAYPLSFYIASRSPRMRYVWLTLVIVPICTNLVIRTYAWMLLLSSQMPPSRVAAWMGWINEGTALYPGTLAIYLGMVTSALPFAVLPIYANVERLDWSLVDAARDLYASNTRVLRSAILPQTLPGLWVAVILTFVPAMGMFVVPQILGGGKEMYVGNLIAAQFKESRNYPYGAAISTALVILTLAALVFIRRRKEGVELI
jgi:spermidine/putrescine transport system permease protein